MMQANDLVVVDTMDGQTEKHVRVHESAEPSPKQKIRNLQGGYKHCPI